MRSVFQKVSSINRIPAFQAISSKSATTTLSDEFQVARFTESENITHDLKIEVSECPQSIAIQYQPVSSLLPIFPKKSEVKYEIKNSQTQEVSSWKIVMFSNLIGAIGIKTGNSTLSSLMSPTGRALWEYLDAHGETVILASVAAFDSYAAAKNHSKKSKQYHDFMSQEYFSFLISYLKFMDKMSRWK
mmetsp:Transcript_47539/g.54739  ORF Transcript_47539/g.54739 Transcript_47539/m.54739 type:complete len:188 (+) Transcript_47539:116-679(+)